MDPVVRTKRFFYLGFVVLFLLLMLLVAYVYRVQGESAKLLINVVPSVSRVTINGSSASSGTVKVRPGSQKVLVSLSGFTSQSQTVTVSAHTTKTLTFVLTANSAQTANWYLAHPADEQKAEQLSSNAADQLEKNNLQNSPLIQYLPYVAGGFEFRVDYGTPANSGGSPAITITSPTLQGQQDGLSWIKSLGYSLSSYNITYVTAPVQPLNSP